MSFLNFSNKVWLGISTGLLVLVIGLGVWASLVQFVFLPRKNAEVPNNGPIAGDDSFLIDIFGGFTARAMENDVLLTFDEEDDVLLYDFGFDSDEPKTVRYLRMEDNSEDSHNLSSLVNMTINFKNLKDTTHNIIVLYDDTVIYSDYTIPQNLFLEFPSMEPQIIKLLVF